MTKEAKKLNLKDKLTDDTLDISLHNLEIVPMKEIVSFACFLLLKLFQSLKVC